MCNCPKCNWEPPDVPFYYCRKGKAIDCSRPASPRKTTIEEIDINEDLDTFILKSIEIDEPNKFRIEGKPPFKHFKSYPICENYHSSIYASYEFGVDGHNWIETHRCPKCNKEYSFDNSDF